MSDTLAKVTARQTRVGAGQVVWFAYVDGQMLRAKNGVGRRFKTEDAALKAASAPEPMTPTKFLSNACPQTREAAEMIHPYEAIIASEVPEAAIASMAHMTDADIQAQINRINALQGSLEYRLSARNADQQATASELHAYGVELIRRRVVADQNTQSEAA